MARSEALAGALLSALAAASAPAGDIAYVTNQADSTLSIVDLDAGAETARIPAPGKPAGVAVAPALDAVFVVSPDDKTLRRFAPDGALQAALTLEGGPIGAAVDGERVFVSDWYNARIWVVDGAAMTVTATLETGAAPAGLAVSEDGRWLASADRDADQLSIFALDDLRLHRRIKVGVRPFAVAFGPRGRVYSADVGSDSVTVADPETGAVLGAMQTGKRPYGAAFAQGKAFVTDQYADTVSVFDLDSFKRLGTVDVGEYPEGVAAAQDGTRIIVTNWFSNTLSVIDAATLDVVDEIAVGDGPRAFGAFIREGK